MEPLGYADGTVRTATECRMRRAILSMWADGLGYEDIACKVKMPPQEVRSIVWLHRYGTRATRPGSAAGSTSAERATEGPWTGPELRTGPCGRT